MKGRMMEIGQRHFRNKERLKEVSEEISRKSNMTLVHMYNNIFKNLK